MVRLMNLQQINIDAMQPYITCKKSVGLHLAKPGLMAGRQAGSLAVQQTKFGRGLKF